MRSIPKNIAIWLATMAAVLSVASVASAQISAPYLETFDAESTCSNSCSSSCAIIATGWVQDPNDDGDWIVDNNGTTSSGTGPSADHTGGGNFLFSESTSCAEGAIKNLISPAITVTPTTAVSFWYHMLGDDMGTMHVDLSTDGGTTFVNDIIPPFTDNVDMWQEQLFGLEAFAGQTVNIRIRAVTGPDFESDMAIDDFALVDFTGPSEPLLVGIDSPLGSICGLTATEQVTVSVANKLGSAVSNEPIILIVDGGTPIVENVAGPILSGAAIQYTFTATADLSGPGFHTIEVSFAGMTQVANVFNGTSLPAPPFVDDLEAASTLTSYRVTGSTSFAYGTPAGTIINAAASGNNAVVTNLTGDYGADEFGSVETACGIDLSGLTEPFIEMDIWYETESLWDGAQVQYSTDGGFTWSVLGSTTSASVNWYNDTDVDGIANGADGWSGSSGGYVHVVHPLTAAVAGQTDVRFRILFGSDGGTQDEGIAIDNFEISDGLAPGATITSVAYPAIDQGGLAQGGFTITQTLELATTGATGADTVTVMNNGTAADADITWHLFFDDNADGIWDASVDTLLDTQPQSSGMATLSTMGLATTPSLSVGRLFVVAEVDTMATVGDTIESQVTNVTLTSGTPTVALPLVTGVTHTIAPLALLPLVDDFSSFLPEAGILTSAGHQHPLATAPGPITGLSTYADDAQAQLLTSQFSLSPVVGASFLGFDYPDGNAAGGLQYMLDLSSLTVVNNDTAWLFFRYTDDGDEDDDEEHVFISVDGGLTWAGSIFFLEPEAVADETWSEVLIDIGAELANLNADFTDRVLIRFGAQDNVDFATTSGDGMFFDEVVIGLPPSATVARMATPVPDEGTDALGALPAFSQSLGYTISNPGAFPLTVSGISSANETMVSNVVVTPPTDAVIPPGGMGTFTVDFEPDVGSFSLDIQLTVDDPSLTDSTYNFTISGEGLDPTPDIDVLTNGTSVPAGSNVDQGTIEADTPMQLTYTVESLGEVDLNISQVAVGNATNVAAGITLTPMQVIPPNGSSEFIVQYSVLEEGAFSFDIVVTSDDPDENPYTITVSGTGTDANAGVGGGGMGVGGGSSGDGGSDIVYVPVPTPSAEDDGGCGCKVVSGGSDDEDGLGFAAFALLGLVVARRRRNRAA